MRPASKHILGLDLVRFGAALMVMTFHLAYWSWAPTDSLTKDYTGGTVAFHYLAPVTWMGWVGVEVFFVISGFVISYSAFGVKPVSFLRNRFVRLYPAAWICGTITLITVVLLGRANGVTAIAYAHTMVLWVQGPWIDGVYWTLGIEIIFYALVFLTLCLGQASALPRLLVAMAVVSSVFWFGLAFDRAWPDTLPLGFLHNLRASAASAFLLLRHGCFFALGGMLWLYRTRRLAPTWACLFALCLAAGMFEIAESAREIVQPIGDSVLKRAAVCFIWLAAVACLAAMIHFDALVRRILARWETTIRVLGLMTYPLYLLHDIIGATLLKAAALAGFPPLAALGLAITGVLGLSLIVTRMLEPPIQAWLRTILSRSRLPAVQRDSLQS